MKNGCIEMKRKVLFMVQIPPPVHGAALRNLSLIESTLLQEHFHIKLLPLAFADSIFTIGKYSFAKMVKSFKYAGNLISTLITLRPEIAYFTITPAGGAFYRDCLFVAILKLFGIRIIYHLRGIGIHSARNRSKLNKFLYPLVFKNTFVVCLSKNHLKDIAGLPYRKHFIVPNGIKVEMKQEFINQVDVGKQKILFLSNFVKSKGVYEFLKALSQLKKENIEFKAMLVGADYDVTRKDIQTYIDEHDLADYATVFGPAYKEEKFRMIGNCDIFVFPTYYTFELFPGVILEAMQCSKPVVSTYHGVIEDILDDGVTGLLVAPKNVDDLVDKIKYLINHPAEARAMGKRAGEKFYENYSLDKFERNIKCVFEDALKSE
jgi:glycosyltransferase involved in cell wall biosynthesis